MKYNNFVRWLSFLFLVSIGGCMSSTNFIQWSGEEIYQGNGGAYMTEDSIDIFTIGAPEKKFRLLGFAENKIISSSEFNAMFGDSISKSALVAEAKKQGGDAILLLSSHNEILGYRTSGQAMVNTYAPNYGGYGYGFAQGSAHTSTTINSRKVAAIIKYLSE